MPDYKRIFNDILNKKCPDKKELCLSILDQQQLSVLDVIKLNTIIFGVKDKNSQGFNQKHKSYDHDSIKQILNYQKKNNLNNIELAKKFNLSRNTVTKWKNFFTDANGKIT